jgi:DNA-binding beta-propeller fold protein YncE
MRSRSMFTGKLIMRSSLLLYFSLCCVVAPATVAFAQFKKIRTIAGNGQTGNFRDKGRALEIPLSNPFGVQPEADGSLIIASFDQHVLYRLDPSYQSLERIAGTGEAGFSGRGGEFPTNVAMNQPHEVQINAKGDIYVADTRNHRVGMIDAATRRWEVVAGTGQEGFSGDQGRAQEASLNQAYSIAVDDQELFIADLQNHRIRKVDLRSGIITTICGNGAKQLPTDGGLANQQPLAGPRSLAVDSNSLWIVLREGNSVWRIDRREGRIFHVAGTGEKGSAGDGGDARKAQFNGPKGITVDPGVAIYIADTENHTIRKVNLETRQISTVAGVPGQAGFNGDGDQPNGRLLRRPHGVCLLRGGELLIGDSENHRVRLLTP